MPRNADGAGATIPDAVTSNDRARDHHQVSDTIRALLLSTTGTVTPVAITRDGFLTEVYGLLVCDLVTAVPAGRLTAWVDDEGIGQHEPNRVASAVLTGFYGRPRGEVLHGPVLLTGGVDGRGEVMSIPAAAAEKVTALAVICRQVGGAS